MASNDVLVASPATGTGGILAGPLGTTVPTDTATTLDVALVKHGYVGEDGLSMTTNRSTEKIRAWGGDTVRVVQTEHDVTFSWTFLETNAVTAAAVYGDDNVTATAATSSSGNLLAIKLNSDSLPSKVYVFDMKDGDRKVRVVVPNGQITEVGDTQFVHSNATGHEVTLEAFPDASGVKCYIYSDDGQKTTGA